MWEIKRELLTASRQFEVVVSNYKEGDPFIKPHILRLLEKELERAGFKYNALTRTATIDLPRLADARVSLNAMVRAIIEQTFQVQLNFPLSFGTVNLDQVSIKGTDTWQPAAFVFLAIDELLAAARTLQTFRKQGRVLMEVKTVEGVDTAGILGQLQKLMPRFWRVTVLGESGNNINVGIEAAYLKNFVEILKQWEAEMFAVEKDLYPSFDNTELLKTDDAMAAFLKEPDYLDKVKMIAVGRLYRALLQATETISRERRLWKKQTTIDLKVSNDQLEIKAIDEMVIKHKNRPPVGLERIEREGTNIWRVPRDPDALKGLAEWLKTQYPQVSSGNPAMSPAKDNDAAMTHTKAASRKGGIDLNAQNLNWHIRKDGKGVEMAIDPAMLERIRREGIEGLTPVILNISPVVSIWPLVGLAPPA